MKITKSQLKQIIKEEIEDLLIEVEAKSPFPRSALSRAGSSPSAGEYIQNAGFASGTAAATSPHSPNQPRSDTEAATMGKNLYNTIIKDPKAFGDSALKATEDTPGRVFPDPKPYIEIAKKMKIENLLNDKAYIFLARQVGTLYYSRLIEVGVLSMVAGDGAQTTTSSDGLT